MKQSDTHIFKNEASRRFHDYMYSYSKRDEKAKLLVYKSFGIDKVKNPSTFFNQLRTGHRSVTLDQIYIAKKVFGLNPGYLFEINDQETIGFGSNLLEEPVEEYGFRDTDIQVSAGKKLQEIIKKHKIKVEPYANKRLGISKQAMYDKLNGKTRIYFDEVLMVCEDTGESMDQFRRVPLPKCHHLQQMEMIGSFVYKVNL